MPKTNLSLGNLYRAVSGSARVAQAVSLGGLAGSAANSSLGSFAIDSVTANLPTFTYIVESTTETAGFTFGSPGALHGSKVGTVAANYSVSFNNANFSVGSPTLGATPSFPVTPAAIASSTYSEAAATLSMNYADGYNLNATGYNSTSTKILYAVDVYNTINQPDFCLLFGTKITKADGTLINVEDLNVGDEIKAWVPAGLPDETLDGTDTEQTEWRFYHSDIVSGSVQTVTVSDITFNFAAGYFSINNGTIEATETHPLYVWDAEIGKYKFKNVGDILPGDRLVKEDGTEEEVYDVAIVREDVEIATVNVENADVYISNGLISHNKGTTTQPFIPSSGLRLYLDPSKTASFAAGSLPATGTPTVDWLDLTGWGTGFRPGAQAPKSLANANPSYNNGASRKERYYSLDGGDVFYKDRSSNINGGITQFDVTAMTFLAWVRLPSNLGTQFRCLFSKSGADRDYNFYLYSAGSSVWDGYHFSSARGTISNTVQTFTAPSLNTWYMVGVTISAAAGITYYLDKTSQGTGTVSAFTATSSYEVRIGADDNYFSGHLGPVLFYNRVLTSTEIGQVYDYFSPTYKV